MIHGTDFSRCRLKGITDLTARATGTVALQSIQKGELEDNRSEKRDGAAVIDRVATQRAC